MSEKKPSAPSVIEVLSAGFEQVNKIIWIMLLPILVDLFLWKGPLLSIGPVIDRLLALYAETLPAQLERAQISPTIAGETVQSFEAARAPLQAAAEQFNLFSLLLANIAVIPSVGIANQADPSWTFVLTQPLAILLLVVLLELVGVFLGVLYLGLLAQQIRDGRVDVARLVRTVGRYWLSVIGVLLLFLGIVLFVGIPGGIFLGVMFVISAGLGAGLMAVLCAMVQVGLMLAVVYLFFLTDAIVVSEVGPIRAALNSAKVVARNFWASMGLIVLTFVIAAGTRVIWSYLWGEPWGIVAAMVGNAYIATGLAAASMLFYRTRLARLSEMQSTETEKNGHGWLRRM